MKETTLISKIKNLIIRQQDNKTDNWEKQIMTKSMRQKMFKSAVNDMTADIDETLSDLSKRASHKRIMFARNKDDPFPKHCYFCGTHDNVQCIEFGEANIGHTNILMTCSTCKKWFGDFLLSDETQAIKDI